MAQNEMQNMQMRIQQLINQYKQNPDAFTPTEIEALRDAADQVGIKFKGDFDAGQMGKNFVYELADSVSFGGLSGINNLFDLGIKPAKTNTYDDVGSVLGGLLGFAVPMGVGAKVASKAMGGINRVAKEGTNITQNLLSKLGTKGAMAETKAGGMLDDVLAPINNLRASRAATGADDAAKVAAEAGADSGGMFASMREGLSKAGASGGAQYADAGLQSLARLAAANPNLTRRAIQGATAFGTSDILEDPLGAPGDAIAGALTGGVGVGFGKIASALSQKLGIPMLEAEKLAAMYMYGQRSGDFQRTPYQLAM